MIYSLLSAWTYYAVDFIALAVVLVFAVVNARRGFVDCLFGFISTLVAILFAFLLMKTFVRITGGVFGLQGLIERGCTSALLKLKGFDLDISAQGITETLSGKIPKFLINIVVENIAKGDAPAGTTVASVVAQTISGYAINLIAWILLFFLAKLIIHFLQRFLSVLVKKLPIVGSVNTLLGLAVGILEGVLIVSIVVAVFGLFPSLALAEFFNGAFVIKVIYNHNPLLLVLKLFLN